MARILKVATVTLDRWAILVQTRAGLGNRRRHTKFSILVTTKQSPSEETAKYKFPLNPPSHSQIPKLDHFESFKSSPPAQHKPLLHLPLLLNMLYSIRHQNSSGSLSPEHLLVEVVQGFSSKIPIATMTVSRWWSSRLRTRVSHRQRN